MFCANLRLHLIVRRDTTESRLTGEPYDTETVTYGSARGSWKSVPVVLFVYL